MHIGGVRRRLRRGYTGRLHRTGRRRIPRLRSRLMDLTQAGRQPVDGRDLRQLGGERLVRRGHADGLRDRRPGGCAARVLNGHAHCRRRGASLGRCGGGVLLGLRDQTGGGVAGADHRCGGPRLRERGGGRATGRRRRRRDGRLDRFRVGAGRRRHRRVQYQHLHCVLLRL